MMNEIAQGSASALLRAPSYAFTGHTTCALTCVARKGAEPAGQPALQRDHADVRTMVARLASSDLRQHLQALH